MNVKFVREIARSTITQRWLPAAADAYQTAVSAGSNVSRAERRTAIEVKFGKEPGEVKR